MPPEASPLTTCWMKFATGAASSRGSCVRTDSFACRSAATPPSTTRPVSSTYACCGGARARASRSARRRRSSCRPRSSAAARRRSRARRAARARATARRAAAARGFAIIARPSASICCSPPESVPGLLVAALVEAREELEDVREVALRDAALHPRAEPQVVEHRERRERAAPLGHVRDARAAPSTPVCAGRPCSPSSSTSPLVLTVPEIARSVVVLPAPFAPRIATKSPSSTLSETPCSARISPYRASTSRSSRSDKPLPQPFDLRVASTRRHAGTTRRRRSGARSPRARCTIASAGVCASLLPLRALRLVGGLTRSTARSRGARLAAESGVVGADRLERDAREPQQQRRRRAPCGPSRPCSARRRCRRRRRPRRTRGRSGRGSARGSRRTTRRSDRRRRRRTPRCASSSATYSRS